MVWVIIFKLKSSLGTTPFDIYKNLFRIVISHVQRSNTIYRESINYFSVILVVCFLQKNKIHSTYNQVCIL